MAVDRRTWWAAGAAAVLMGLAIWNLAGDGTPPSPRTVQARAAADARQAPVEAPVAVQLDRLAADRSSPAATRRNPFAFGSRVASPEPVVERPAPPSETAPANPPPSGAPAAAPIALKFIGIVESATGLRLAVLTDGKVVSHGEEGDIIEGRYRILKIGVESIEIAHVDGRGRQTIRLTGQ